MLQPGPPVLKTDKSLNTVIAEQKEVMTHRKFNLFEEKPTGIRASKSNVVVTSHYTILSFFPVNLYEQFWYKKANIYFAALMCLQLFPEVSITSGVPTMGLPLATVLALSALKDALEDYRRHKSDKLENLRVTERMTPNGLEKKRWRDVKVGDTLLIKNTEHIPADVVILATSDSMGSAYVETANLDGETNLKVKTAPYKCMTHFSKCAQELSLDQTLENWYNVPGTMECEDPNGNLHNFDGCLKLGTGAEMKKIAISSDNLMLRGCKARNTAWCVVMVVFTGYETKIQQNQTAKNIRKISQVEVKVEYILVGVLIFEVLICLIAAIWNATFETGATVNGGDLVGEERIHHYLGLVTDTVEPSFIEVFCLRFLTFVLIFANLIPISLMVTLSVGKFLQALFIQCDNTMVHKNQKTIARTSDLNEEMGQVEYIFSDKTGTLTQNMMEFRKFSLNGITYGQGLTEIRRQVLQRSGQPVPSEPPPRPNAKITPSVNFNDEDIERHMTDPNKKPDFYEFFLHLAINQTVMAEENANGETNFSASSPDEGALVFGAFHFGFEFKERGPGRLTITIPSFNDPIKRIDVKVELLAIMDFSSERKRSSVLVRFHHPVKNRLVTMLYTKGADSVIMPRLTRQCRENPEFAKSLESMNSFALDGLRTLMFAGREVDPEQAESWLEDYEMAMSSLRDRKERIDMCSEAIEMNLEFHAVTGLEDRLQDDVGNTISILQEAGIKVWMLTGDKVETAINIGVATGLLENDTPTHLMPIFNWNEIVNQEPRDVPDDFAKRIHDSMDLVRIEERNSQQSQTRKSSDGAAAGSHRSIDSSLLDSQKLVELEAMHRTQLESKRKEVCIDYFQKCIERVKAQPGCYKALVVDGQCLTLLLEDELGFLELSRSCRSVLCCRVSPDQKGQIVRLMKKHTGKVTLAIGDGANDCNMIRSAHVGIGIKGEEGIQAFNVSDYGIGQFKFLRGLLLVHGRQSYRKLAYLIQYMFYKNIVVVTPQFMMATLSRFSGQKLYPDIMYQFYNVLFTGTPIFIHCIFDNDVPRKVSMVSPDLYKLGPANFYLTPQKICYFFLTGAWHGIIVFWIPYTANSSTYWADGKPGDLWYIGYLVIVLELVVVNAKLIFDSYSLMWVTYLSLAVCFMMLLLCSIGMDVAGHFVGLETYGVLSTLASEPMTWAVGIVTLNIALLGDYIAKVMQRNYFPSSIDKAIEEISRPTAKGTKSRAMVDSKSDEQICLDTDKATTSSRYGQASSEIYPITTVGESNHVVSSTKFTYTPSDDSQLKLIHEMQSRGSTRPLHTPDQ